MQFVYKPSYLLGSFEQVGEFYTEVYRVDEKQCATKSLDGRQITVKVLPEDKSVIELIVTDPKKIKPTFSVRLSSEYEILEVEPGRFYFCAAESAHGIDRVVRKLNPLMQSGAAEPMKPLAFAQWFAQTHGGVNRKYKRAYGSDQQIRKYVLGQAEVESFCLRALKRRGNIMEEAKTKAIGVVSDWIVGVEFNDAYNRIDWGKWPISGRLDGVKEILQQVKDLHDSGVIVIDISNSNLMIDDHKWFLIDFASAVRLKRGEESVKSTVRSWEVAAPEVIAEAIPLYRAQTAGYFKPQCTFNKKTDIYALGNLLCLLLYPWIVCSPKEFISPMRTRHQRFQFSLTKCPGPAVPEGVYNFMSKLQAMTADRPEDRTSVEELLGLIDEVKPLFEELERQRKIAQARASGGSAEVEGSLITGKKRRSGDTDGLSAARAREESGLREHRAQKARVAVGRTLL
jgi:tRNA A-37 threonylcarbamoyl transferase component Bud32